MANSFIEHQIENKVGDKAACIMKRISALAAKQGGETTAENYKLLGKRALIVLGAVVVTAQVTASIVGLIVSRKNEEQRVERIVRRVLEEERQEQEASQQSTAAA